MGAPRATTVSVPAIVKPETTAIDVCGRHQADRKHAGSANKHQIARESYDSRAYFSDTIEVMLTRLQSYIDESYLLPPNSRLVLAISGGIDSVVLLDLLAQLKDAREWGLVVAHVDHKVRPGSDQDAIFVSELADRYGLPFRLGQLNPASSSEAELRRGRYDFLESVRQGEKADYIVTAHHGGDRIETAILNLVRGADRSGVVALKPTRGQIVRPLLGFTRGDILTYASLHDLPYREDPTNASPTYLRNVIRHQVLADAPVNDPHFRVKFVSKLDELEQLNSKIDYGLERLVEQVVEIIDQDKIVLSRTGFLKLPSIVRLNLFIHLIKKLNPNISLTTANLEVALDFLLNAKTGTHRYLKNSLKISRSYDTLVISREPGEVVPVSKPESALLRVGGSLNFGDFVLDLSTASSGNGEAMKLTPMDVYVRSWQPGDRIYQAQINGSRKLQDIFVDAKIPREQRSYWPVVVTRSNEVICVPTLAQDGRFTSDSDQAYHLSAVRTERKV